MIKFDVWVAICRVLALVSKRWPWAMPWSWSFRQLHANSPGKWLRFSSWGTWDAAAHLCTWSSRWKLRFGTIWTRFTCFQVFTWSFPYSWQWRVYLTFCSIRCLDPSSIRSSQSCLLELELNPAWNFLMPSLMYLTICSSFQWQALWVSR